jgi:hypothetical protein
MIYTKNLQNTLLQRHHSNGADELIILSGYSGPSPIKKASSLGIKLTFIHGIKSALDNRLLHTYQNLSVGSSKVLVSDYYNHSKVYCWLKGNSPVDVLGGSANFSNNGLNSRVDGESLYEIEKNDFSRTFNYLIRVMNDSKHCSKVTLPRKPIPSVASTMGQLKYDRVIAMSPPKAEIYLGGRGRTIQTKSGLNWGHGRGNNNADTAEIRLRNDLVNAIPALFPFNGVNPNSGSGQSFKSSTPDAEFLFDDGYIMDISFEGIGGSSKIAKGLKNFKQFSSFPSKSILGGYFRRRLGLPPGTLVADNHLLKYGRDTITLELISPGVYFCDFSI